MKSFNNNHVAIYLSYHITSFTIPFPRTFISCLLDLSSLIIMSCHCWNFCNTCFFFSLGMGKGIIQLIIMHFNGSYEFVQLDVILRYDVLWEACFFTMPVMERRLNCLWRRNRASRFSSRCCFLSSLAFYDIEAEITVVPGSDISFLAQHNSKHTGMVSFPVRGPLSTPWFRYLDDYRVQDPKRIKTFTV